MAEYVRCGLKGIYAETPSADKKTWTVDKKTWKKKSLATPGTLDAVLAYHVNDKEFRFEKWYELAVEDVEE